MGAVMKRSARLILVLGAVAVVVLIFLCVGDELSSERSIRVKCVYYGNVCVSPGIFSGASIRLFP
ncbi:hypothetical protein [Burkholderia sp. PU8-34]